ncbi:hypothetical protein [Nitrosomonas sp.]|uniref:hypothetical protein n=1 Tax=Nitrosomonas sp. TaxID=42353 RepID=UPI002603B74E|nr:hypothetical protein [Nitrosomonas sp.]
MADLEQARAMLRMAHKDFNALVGMLGSARPQSRARIGTIEGWIPMPKYPR